MLYAGIKYIDVIMYKQYIKMSMKGVTRKETQFSSVSDRLLKYIAPRPLPETLP